VLGVDLRESDGRSAGFPIGWHVDSVNDLAVIGSAELVQSLMRRDLIDEYLLTIYPLVLGTGRRLFATDGTFASLRLIDSTTTTTGVIIATYQPTGRRRE
jgi:dihydrofolate reductase